MFFTKNSSISHTHQHIQHLLDFLEDSPIALGLLEAYNFGVGRLQEGRGLLFQAVAAYANAQVQLNLQKAATVAFHEQWIELRRLHQLHLLAARRVLGSESKTLLSKSPDAYLNWLTHTRSFYNVILENGELQEQLRQQGILIESLAEVNQKLDELVMRKKLQTQAVEALRLANQTSQQQQRALQQWYREFSLAAPLAFRQVPSLLALLHPISPRKSKKQRTQTRAKKQTVVAAQA